jgi:hypothetical protein
MDHKDWKLFRCIYDEMGQHAIEGEGDDGRFEKCVENGYGTIGWLIGEPVEHNDYTVVRVVLEGSKKVLEHVLELVRMADRDEAEWELNMQRRINGGIDGVDLERGSSGVES